jgi:hypothetical protein
MNYILSGAEGGRDVLLAILLLWFCFTWLAFGLLWAVWAALRARHGPVEETTGIGDKIVIVSRFE